LYVNIPLSQSRVSKVDEEDLDLVGDCSWSFKMSGTKGYAYRLGPRPERKSVYLHREIGIRLFGSCIRIDHVNGDGLDNRRVNLRPASVSQNAQNSQKWRKPTSSKYKGVYFSKANQRWAAMIGLNGRKTFLGYFENEADAASAYNLAAHEMFGQFALLNQVFTE
jgi:hypothetical protein